MKTCSIALLALLLAGGTPLVAQEPAPAPAPAQAEQGLRVRGLSFALTTAPTEVYAHDAASPPGIPGTKVDVKNYLNHEFNLLPIKGKGIVFTKSSDPGSVKDNASVLAKASLPDNFRSGILMFLPGTGAAGTPAYRILVVEDTVRAFPRGSFKVMNLSPTTLRIQLEKETFEFKGGEMKLIEKPPVNDSNASGMRAFAQVGNQWQKVGAGIWPNPGSKRVIQVAFENPNTKQLEIRGIRDISVND